MSVNEVVVKGFFPPFFAAAVAMNKNINVSPRGGCGVTARGQGRTINVPSISLDSRHCEIRHIIVNHCLNTIKELQR